jgi:Xaa-Pro aminopeptidase
MRATRFKTRRARVLESLGALEADAVIVTHLPNVRYLTGFSGTAGILVLESVQEPVFITDSRYVSQSKEEIGELPIRKVVGSYDETLARYARDRAYRTLAYEEAHCPVSRLRFLESSLPETTRLMGCQGLVESLRAVKDEEEVERLERAARGLEPTVDSLRDEIRAGVSERNVAAELDYRLRHNGYDKTAFDTIVASGPRSALPHGRPTDRRFEPGDLVVIDFGGVMDGYASDVTRTFSVGEPSPEARRIYDIVREAQRAAIAAIHPGIEAQKVDRAARDVIESANLGEFFGHGTGHGIGLEVHESPWISPGRAERLQAGMVFTVEPGIYIPGQGGVRLEDDVVVTKEGCRLLSRAEKALQEFSWVCYV